MVRLSYGMKRRVTKKKIRATKAVKAEKPTTIAATKTKVAVDSLRINRLAKKVKTLVKDQYEKLLMRYVSNLTTTLPIMTMNNIIDFSQANRLFTSPSDSPYTNTCYLNSVTINFRFQCTRDAINGFPLHITGFLLSPKWTKRQTLSSTSSTVMDATTKFIKDQDFHYGSFWGSNPIINSEYYTIHKRKRFTLMPTIDRTTNLQSTFPNTNWYHNGSFKYKPQKKQVLRAKGATQAWNLIEKDDIPFTKQIFMVWFINYNNTLVTSAEPTGYTGIQYSWDTIYNITQVQA